MKVGDWTCDREGVWSAPLVEGARAEVERTVEGGWRATVVGIACAPRAGSYGVSAWDEPAATVSGSGKVDNARAAVADPRPASGAWQRVAGVTPWDEPAPTVTAGAKIHAGAFQVADPRGLRWHPLPAGYRLLTLAEALALELPADKAPPFIPVIIAADGTWHRPLTTLELAALQGFDVFPGGKPLVLDGTSHTRWREGVGNAVPPPAAEAVGHELLRSLLAGAVGASFSLSSTDIWVRPELKAEVAP